MTKMSLRASGRLYKLGGCASGELPKRPKGSDCNSAVYDFGGSNPSLATHRFPGAPAGARGNRFVLLRGIRICAERSGSMGPRARRLRAPRSGGWRGCGDPHSPPRIVRETPEFCSGNSNDKEKRPRLWGRFCCVPRVNGRFSSFQSRTGASRGRLPHFRAGWHLRSCGWCSAS